MGDVQLGPVTNFTPSDVATLWVKNGGAQERAWTATAIVFGSECPSGNAGILNDTASTGDYSVGLWQLNYLPNGPWLTQNFGTAKQLADDPNLQAKAAIAMSNNGTNWSSWGPDFGYSGYGLAVTSPLPGSKVAVWLAAHPAPTGAPNPGTSAPYKNPLRGLTNLVMERVDQGVDFSGSGPIYAIGPGVVDVVVPLGGDSGWDGQHTRYDGGYVKYHFTEGPAAGKYVYVAENVEPQVSAGDKVDSSTVVCTLIDAPPNCEMGWAAGAEGTQSAHDACNPNDQYKDVGYTAMGDNFNKLLIALGAQSGNETPPLVGAPCPGFPTSWDLASPGPQPPPPPKPFQETAMSTTVIDFNNPGVPQGRKRFVELVPDAATKTFTLKLYNGAKVSNYDGKPQASNGVVLGIELAPGGVEFTVTAGDGGTFTYAFAKD